jgi:flagellar biogenesis protein FliO
MVDVGVGALLLRTVVSMVIVLALVGAAYAIAKRRGPGRMPGTTRRSSRGGSRQPLTVEARAGLSRSAAVAAVRFGDKVLLVGVADHAAPSVLAELPAEAWAAGAAPVSNPAAAALIDPAAAAVIQPPVASNDVFRAGRPSFVDALRDLTTRR